MSLRSGFSLGDWNVYPREGRLVSSLGEQHVQPKAMEVLLCLAERSGNVVEWEEILQAVWGETIPSDAALTQCIDELRNALGDNPVAPNYILTIADRGYRLALPVNLPSADKEKNEAHTEKKAARSVEVRRRRRIARSKKIAVGVFVLLVAAFIEVFFERFLEDSDFDIDSDVAVVEGAPPDHSIAVLPFVNMSGDVENEYFSDGLTETLLHTLAGVPSLMVAARTSSFAFKDKQADVREVARALGVAHILEGSVQRSGNRVRVTAQLVRAEDGFHVWSENFDQELVDIFAVQDTISNQVARALVSTLQNEPFEITSSSIDTRDADAYDLYLRALTRARQNSFDSLTLAESGLKEAIALDPEFKQARLELAQLYVDQAYTGLIAWSESMPKAIVLVDELLRSDSEDVLARAVQAKIEGFDAIRNFDRTEIRIAASKLEAAISKHPNAVWMYRWMALFQAEIGNYKAAIDAIQRGLTIDPLSHHLHSKKGEVLYRMGRLEESAHAFARVRELEPEGPGGYSSGGTVARAQRDYVSYVPLMLRSMELDPADHELPLRFAGVLYSLGLVQEAERWYQQGYDIAPDAPATLRYGLDRGWLLGDIEMVRDLARRILEDRVENRVGSDFASAAFYVHAQHQLGALDEVPAFLESISPGITDPRHRISLSRDYWMKLALIEALFTMEPRLAREHAEFLDSYVREAFPLFIREPRLRASQLVTLGRRDEAVNVALEEDLNHIRMAEGISAYASGEYEFIATLRSLTDDPAVASAISNIEKVRQSDAEQMRNLLAEHVGI